MACTRDGGTRSGVYRTPVSVEARPHAGRHCGTRSPSGEGAKSTTMGRSIRRSSAGAPTSPRSEEHTSELQSPCNLVCRLLLEKKKKRKSSSYVTTRHRRYR